MEKYQPSDEEVEKAEENMTFNQKELSGARMASSRVLKDRYGVTGYLEVIAGSPNVTGMINGHKVEIMSKHGNWAGGKVDDKIDLSKDEAKSIADKYSNAIAKYREDIFEMAKDIEGSEKLNILKEIGL